jgi:hypothetical protein
VAIDLLRIVDAGPWGDGSPTVTVEGRAQPLYPTRTRDGLKAAHRCMCYYPPHHIVEVYRLGPSGQWHLCETWQHGRVSRV